MLTITLCASQSIVGPKLVAGASVDLFRPTRPPRLDVSSASIVQRAEHGVCALQSLFFMLIYVAQANFLRTYFPDIDITAELVRQELSTDAQFSRELEQYDPFLANVLELQHGAPLFVAFPMGVIGSDLSTSASVSTCTELLLLNYNLRHLALEKDRRPGLLCFRSSCCASQVFSYTHPAASVISIPSTWVRYISWRPYIRLYSLASCTSFFRPL